MQFEVVVLIKHQGLIAVFEEGKVLEFDEPDRDVALVYEETSEQHEWNDEYWSKGNCQLLIREDC